MEWSHAVAPGANIVVVEAGSDLLANLLAAVDTARHLPDVSVISMSWGVSEFASETSFDALFTTPAGHISETFVASTGDTATASTVQWPAASPNVVSVGGSTLNTAAAAGTASETDFVGAVTGTSQFEPAPPYQSSSGTNVDRKTPDVVYNANPIPGFSIYDSNQGGWETVGGTSAGARSGRRYWPSPTRPALMPARLPSMAPPKRCRVCMPCPTSFRQSRRSRAP